MAILRAVPILFALIVLCLARPSHAVKRSAGCGSTGQPTGDFHLKTTDGRGTIRDYEVLVPASYSPTTPLSLTIVYHGANGTQANAKALGLQAAPGAAAASVFVFPQGVPFQNFGVGWDDTCGGYDMVLFDRMLSALGTRYCIDLERVFVAGFSWGCDHTTALACCRGNKIRAVAAASCTNEYAVHSDYRTYANFPCPTTNAAAIRYTHAVTGDDAYPDPVFATTSQLYRSMNRCSATSVAVSPSPCRSFQGCANPLIECAYPNLGHSVPSGWAADSWSFFAKSRVTPPTPGVPAMPPAGTASLALLLVGAFYLRRGARGPGPRARL